MTCKTEHFGPVCAVPSGHGCEYPGTLIRRSGFSVCRCGCGGAGSPGSSGFSSYGGPGPLVSLA